MKMKKSIQGRRWNGNSPVKGTLNEILGDKEVFFEEKETKDNVSLNFRICKNQYALYSSEYKPSTTTEVGRKKVDITVFIAEEDKNRARYYLADVKKDVGGKDVIFHLLEQWKAGIKYIKHSILAYLPPEVEVEKHVMVITRNFDINRVSCEKEIMQLEYEEWIENAKRSLAAKKQLLIKGSKNLAETKILEKFEAYEFIYEDGKEKELFTFEVGNAIAQTENTYLYEMTIEL